MGKITKEPMQAPAHYLKGSDEAAVVLTCEHAGERLPVPWRWSDSDRRLVGTHWASDLGAADLTRELSASLHAPAVLSNFSRLLVDPNRPLDADTLFRELADGVPVELNQAISADEREQRLAQFYRPYHALVDHTVGRGTAGLVFAIHSFTPTYEGQIRNTEIGVLFDQDAALGAEMADAFDRAGFVVGLNEPYSGADGFMFAADHHARAHDRAALEIEVRQDLATDPSVRVRITDCLVALFGR